MAYFKKEEFGITNQKGEIHRFSEDGLLKVCNNKNLCFSCAQPLTKKNRENEHVFPRWLIKLEKLQDALITLPNGRVTGYSKLVVPCCGDCNASYKRIFEDVLAPIFKEGYRAVKEFFDGNGEHLLYAWLAFISAKQRVLTASYRYNPDLRETPVRFFERDDLTGLSWMLALAQNLRLGGSNEHIKNIGIFPWVPTDFSYQSFHFQFDPLQNYSVLICQGVGLTASFSDGSPFQSHKWLYSLERKRGFSTLQILEIAARYTRISYCYEKQYFRNFTRNAQSVIGMPKDKTVRVLDVPKELYGQLLLGTTARLLAKGITNQPEWEHVIENLIQGEISFVHPSLAKKFVDESRFSIGPVPNDLFEDRIEGALITSELLLSNSFEQPEKR